MQTKFEFATEFNASYLTYLFSICFSTCTVCQQSFKYTHSSIAFAEHLIIFVLQFLQVRFLVLQAWTILTKVTDYLHTFPDG